MAAEKDQRQILTSCLSWTGLNCSRCETQCGRGFMLFYVALQWFILCGAFFFVSHPSLSINVTRWRTVWRKVGCCFVLLCGDSLLSCCTWLRCVALFILPPCSPKSSPLSLCMFIFSLPFLFPILPHWWVVGVEVLGLEEVFLGSLEMELAMNTMWGHWARVLSSSRLCRLKSLFRV